MNLSRGQLNQVPCFHMFSVWSLLKGSLKIILKRRIFNIDYLKKQGNLKETTRNRNILITLYYFPLFPFYFPLLFQLLAKGFQHFDGRSEFSLSLASILIRFTFSAFSQKNYNILMAAKSFPSLFLLFSFDFLFSSQHKNPNILMAVNSFPFIILFFTSLHFLFSDK